MIKEHIYYRDGYKYQLVASYEIKTSIHPGKDVDTDYITLDINGNLTIKKGYAWDGPSGPTIDTPSFMRGSLIHDALYQLIREELVDFSWRKEADKELVRICKEDGMSALRAWWIYQGVRFGGRNSATSAMEPSIKKAP